MTAHGLQARAEQIAARLPPLVVAAERVAATVSQGVHGRRRVGAGETFWQFRRYHPGDSISSIDWRQTAKRDHVFVRQTEWEAAETVWLWRDRSPSMRFRSHLASVEKGDRADLLTLALASLLLRGGERVALLGSGRRLPFYGKHALERVAEALVEPDASDADAPSLPPVAALPRDSQLVLIGDFLDPVDKIAERVRAFAAERVPGHIVQVLDPAEHTLPYSGRTLFEGLEQEGELLVKRVDSLRARYAERLAAHQEGLKALARASGWTLTLHNTDRPPESALLALYAALSRRR